MKSCIAPEVAAKLKESLLKGELDPNAIANMLPEEKAALKAMLNDFVAEKYKVGVSSKELSTIKTIAKKITEAQKAVGGEIGNPEKLNENLAFFKAKKEMDDYLRGVSPSSKMKVLTGTIGRGMMLASPKSAILNIGSNMEVGFTEALSRRIANGTLKSTDNALALDYMKMVNKIYQETGYDVSRMMHVDDVGSSGERVLGNTVHAQGGGMVRAIGRGVEDVVFKQLMGAPDVAFSAAHFADSVNLQSLRLAKGDKALARTYMNDAMRLEPTTPQGELLRSQGILDAQVATWTNTTWASKATEKIRSVFNDLAPDARIGDYLFPFVKTPSNVIATGLDYAGMGIPKALIKSVQALRAGEFGTKAHWQSMSRDIVRSGLGLTGAAVIVYNLGPDNFMGAYDPNRSQVEQLRNSNYNAIKFRGKWISTDWLGPLAVPVTAMMYAAKYGKTPGEKAFQYGKGLKSAVLNLPVISDIYSFVQSQSYKQNQTLQEMTGEAQNYILEQIYSRLVPSILADIAIATDKNQRQTSKGFEAIKAKIPGVRETLPIKTNIFGENLQTEPGWSQILFGSRVKTAKDTPITDELTRISDTTGKSVNFTDFNKSSSKQLAQFRQKVGPTRYAEAKQYYGEQLQKLITKEMNSGSYKRLNDLDKQAVITGLDTKAMNYTFIHYRFVYKPDKKTKK